MRDTPSPLIIAAADDDDKRRGLPDVVARHVINMSIEPSFLESSGSYHEWTTTTTSGGACQIVLATSSARHVY